MIFDYPPPFSSILYRDQSILANDTSLMLNFKGLCILYLSSDPLEKIEKKEAIYVSYVTPSLGYFIIGIKGQYV